MAAEKPPIRNIASDDFAVVVGGEVYHPHKGENVSFRSRLRPQDITTALRLKNLQVSEDPEALEAGLEELTTFLQSRILSTTWTDEQDQPYESVEAMLADADFDELAWLLEKAVSREGPALGEASTPSTVRSTGRARRRPTG